MAPSLSPSRANDFMQCPLLYRLRAIDRLPEPQSAAAARGTLVHAVLEKVFDLPAIERTPEAAAAMVPGEWARMLHDEPERAELVADGDEAGWVAQASALVETWFRLENPQRLEPAGREQLVSSPAAAVTLKGYIDRLDVAPTGEVRIVDYKTGKAPRPQYQDKAMFQMRFYAVIHRALTGVLATQLQIVYLGSGEILRHAPTHEELDAVERKVDAIWAAITRAVATERFEASPSRLCDWCHHQSICPSFGGTPPPFPADAARQFLAGPAPRAEESLDEAIAAEVESDEESE